MVKGKQVTARQQVPLLADFALASLPPTGCASTRTVSVIWPSVRCSLVLARLNGRRPIDCEIDETVDWVMAEDSK